MVPVCLELDDADTLDTEFDDAYMHGVFVLLNSLLSTAIGELNCTVLTSSISWLFSGVFAPLSWIDVASIFNCLSFSLN